MRKELVCYLSTTEKGVDINVRSLGSDKEGVLFTTELGKFAVKMSDLVEALTALKEFDVGTVATEVVNDTVEIVYGENLDD